MTSNDEASLIPDEDGLNRDEFSDFILVLKDGRELPCHKFALAKASRVFRVMLRLDCEETLTCKMKVTEFEPDTAESFLDFIYADLQHIPDQDVFKKKFDEKRLTLDLLRMSHMYEVTILQEKCIEYLKKNIVDTNVVEVWSAAETTGSVRLKDAALHYLGKKGKEMLDVPRMKEAYHSPQLMESLVKYTSSRIDPSADAEITVHMDCSEYWKGKKYAVKVRPSDTIKTLRILTSAALSRDGQGHWDCRKVSLSFEQQLPSRTDDIESSPLHDYKTIANYGIIAGSTFTCELK